MTSNSSLRNFAKSRTNRAVPSLSRTGNVLVVISRAGRVTSDDIGSARRVSRAGLVPRPLGILCVRPDVMRADHGSSWMVGREWGV